MFTAEQKAFAASEKLSGVLAFACGMVHCNAKPLFSSPNMLAGRNKFSELQVVHYFDSFFREKSIAYSVSCVSFLFHKFKKSGSERKLEILRSQEGALARVGIFDRYFTVLADHFSWL